MHDTATEVDHSSARLSSKGLQSDDDFDDIQEKFDSGLQAWLQVLGSWILFFNTW